jgi:hypothetical protein
MSNRRRPTVGVIFCNAKYNLGFQRVKLNALSIADRTRWPAQLRWIPQTREDNREKIYKSCQKHDFLSLHDIVCFVCNRPHVKRTYTVTVQDTTEYSCFISYRQNTIPLYIIVFLIEIYWFLLTINGRSPFPKKTHAKLTLNIPSLPRQRSLPSWVPRRTPCFFFCNFSTADYSNYGFWVSETIMFKFTTFITWK